MQFYKNTEDKWTDKVINNEILKKTGTGRKIQKAIVEESD